MASCVGWYQLDTAQTDGTFYNTQIYIVPTYCIARIFGRGKFDEFGKLSPNHPNLIMAESIHSPNFSLTAFDSAIRQSLKEQLGGIAYGL